jgi:hypothetical protein
MVEGVTGFGDRSVDLGPPARLDGEILVLLLSDRTGQGYAEFAVSSFITDAAIGDTEGTPSWSPFQVEARLSEIERPPAMSKRAGRLPRLRYGSAKSPCIRVVFASQCASLREAFAA